MIVIVRSQEERAIMNDNIYLFILVMAGVTYLIRLIPLALIKIDIESVYVKTFLYYVPFVTLTVMTFPAVFTATATMWSALCGVIIAIFLAYQGRSLFHVSAAACISAFIIELVVT